MGSNRPPDPERVVAAVHAIREYGSISEASRRLGIPRATLDRWVEMYDQGLIPEVKKFNTDPLPNELLPVESLIKRRKEEFKQYDAAKKARKFIPIRIPIDGPIAISHFGDPHLDDDGTDLERIENEINIINKTEGMYAANIGDTINNWVGRLARLYGDQGTSAKQAWQLFEWFATKTRWLYFLDGNHGAWSGEGDPAKWILRNQGGIHAKMSARLNLVFPNKREVRVNATHKAPGHSMYNPAHGVGKKAKFGWDDHVIIAGHTHESGYIVLSNPRNGVVSHCIRVASYKIWDRYADEMEFEDHAFFSNAVTIIDPAATSEINLVHVMFDVGEAAEFLKWKRKRK